MVSILAVPTQWPISSDKHVDKGCHNNEHIHRVSQPAYVAILTRHERSFGTKRFRKGECNEATV